MKKFILMMMTALTIFAASCSDNTGTGTGTEPLNYRDLSDIDKTITAITKTLGIPEIAGFEIVDGALKAGTPNIVATGVAGTPYGLSAIGYAIMKQVGYIQNTTDSISGAVDSTDNKKATITIMLKSSNNDFLDTPMTFSIEVTDGYFVGTHIEIPKDSINIANIDIAANSGNSGPNIPTVPDITITDANPTTVTVADTGTPAKTYSIPNTSTALLRTIISKLFADPDLVPGLFSVIIMYERTNDKTVVFEVRYFAALGYSTDITTDITITIAGGDDKWGEMPS